MISIFFAMSAEDNNYINPRNWLHRHKFSVADPVPDPHYATTTYLLILCLFSMLFMHINQICYHFFCQNCKGLKV